MNREQQCIDTLRAIIKHPDSTSLELSQRSGEDRHLLARRLPDLEESHLVKRLSKKRPCRASKTAHVSFVWTPTWTGIKYIERLDKQAA